MNDTEIMHELAANTLLVSSVNFFFNVLGGSALKSCWLETLFIKNNNKKKKTMLTKQSCYFTALLLAFRL